MAYEYRCLRRKLCVAETENVANDDQINEDTKSFFPSRLDGNIFPCIVVFAFIFSPF